MLYKVNVLLLLWWIHFSFVFVYLINWLINWCFFRRSQSVEDARGVNILIDIWCSSIVWLKGVILRTPPCLCVGFFFFVSITSGDPKAGAVSLGEFCFVRCAARTLAWGASELLEENQVAKCVMCFILYGTELLKYSTQVDLSLTKRWCPLLCSV